MRDNRAHAGRWKRLRHANGILEKRTGNQKMCGATRRRGRRKESLVAVAVDGDVVAVAVVGGVVAKVRATPLQQIVTRSLRRPPGQRQTAGSGCKSDLVRLVKSACLGLNFFSYPILMCIHLITFIFSFHNAKGHPLDLKSPSTSEPDKEGP